MQWCKFLLEHWERLFRCQWQNWHGWPNCYIDTKVALSNHRCSHASLEYLLTWYVQFEERRLLWVSNPGLIMSFTEVIGYNTNQKWFFLLKINATLIMLPIMKHFFQRFCIKDWIKFWTHLYFVLMKKYHEIVVCKIVFWSIMSSKIINFREKAIFGISFECVSPRWWNSLSIDVGE